MTGFSQILSNWPSVVMSGAPHSRVSSQPLAWMKNRSLFAPASRITSSVSAADGPLETGP